ncbi:MAG: sigma-70 family RNA polymerase sigma factor [Planctomycetaceae bacterium]|jgi:RNA polymerase sigma-70 factor (ECF subfamily)|nr:sigma-70 family RNA polymerase sigma factor [Planctomycetaceae bacterium]
MNQLTEAKKIAASFKTCADSELVDHFRLGVSEAFDEIDYRYRKSLYYFLLRFTSNSELAEELTQRTLIKAFEMIGQLKFGDKLAGWLHRIAFRLAVSESRCKKNVPLDELPEQFVQHINTVELEEEKQNIWSQAKKHLSHEEYTILSLHYQNNMMLAEIAKQIGKNENTIRVQLHRARKKLQVFL